MTGLSSRASAKALETTIGALRHLAAYFLAKADKQGMELVEKRLIVGKVLHKERLVGSVAIVQGPHAQTLEYAPGISIHHKDGLVRGIEQDRICCLFADARQGEQLPRDKKSVAYRITYQSPQHTLTSEEVN